VARYSALTNGITRAVEDQRLIYSAMAINAAAGIITAFGLVFCLRLRYESLFSAEISAAPPFMSELRRSQRLPRSWTRPAVLEIQVGDMNTHLEYQT